MNPGSLTMNYMDSRNTSVDRRQRIELLDLKDQREGEAHIFFKSKIIRAEMFFANPQPVAKLRLNQFLKVDTAPKNELIELNNRLNNFLDIFKRFNVNLKNFAPNEDIAILSNAFQESYGLRPFERGIAGLIGILEHDITAHKDLTAKYYVQDEPKDSVSIFTSIYVSDIIEKMIGPNNRKIFEQPLLRPDSLLKDLQNIERLSGHIEDKAKNIASALVEELQKTTSFPGAISVKSNVSKEQLLTDVNRLIMHLGGKPYTPPVKDPSTSELTALSELPELPDLPNFAELNDLENHLADLDFSSLGLDDLPNLNDPNELKRLEALLDDDLLKEITNKTEPHNKTSPDQNSDTDTDADDEQK